MVKEGHFMRDCPKNNQGGGNLGNKAQSLSADPPNRDALKGATYGTGGGKTVSMQSLAAKSKRTLQILLRV